MDAKGNLQNIKLKRNLVGIIRTKEVVQKEIETEEAVTIGSDCLVCAIKHTSTVPYISFIVVAVLRPLDVSSVSWQYAVPVSPEVVVRSCWRKCSVFRELATVCSQLLTGSL